MYTAWKVCNVYISFCRQQDYYKELWKKKEPGGKTFHANLKILIDNTDIDGNTDDEEIDVTVDTATPKETKRPRKGTFYKINL